MVYFSEKIPTTLCEIMGRNRSDKGHLDITKSHHNYTTFYHCIFQQLRHQEITLFELGLGTNNLSVASNMGSNGRPGASLYGWREYFSRARIFGADIDRNILFDTERINTFYCDQTDPISINEMWSQPNLQLNFDIIIEDGLHTFDANVCFFENSVHKLKPFGYYIIEDIQEIEKHLFIEKIKEWELTYPSMYFTLLQIPSTINTLDNNLLVVQKGQLG
jgi:hypothetical protein